MQSWDRNIASRLERTSVPQEQGCEVNLNTEQMEPPPEEQQKIITTGLCSPHRGTPLSGTGQVQTADPHSGPHI